MRRMAWIVASGALVLVLIASEANAKDPFVSADGSPSIPCARLLLDAQPATLQHMLGLLPQQTAKLAALRDRYWSKRMGLRLEIAVADRALHRLLITELPDEDRVLQAMRKLRRLGGQLADERTKADLRALATLNHDQRATLREHCFDLAERIRRWCAGDRCELHPDKLLDPPGARMREPWIPSNLGRQPDPLDSGRPFDARYGPPPDRSGWQ